MERPDRSLATRNGLTNSLPEKATVGEREQLRHLTQRAATVGVSALVAATNRIRHGSRYVRLTLVDGDPLMESCQRGR
jgi:hypothetical protein